MQDHIYVNVSNVDHVESEKIEVDKSIFMFLWKSKAIVQISIIKELAQPNNYSTSPNKVYTNLSELRTPLTNSCLVKETPPTNHPPQPKSL